MTRHDNATIAVLGWLALIGSGSAGDIAAACAISDRVAKGRLRALEQRGLVHSARLLHGAPGLHVLTRSGLREAGRPDLDPVAVSVAGFAHLLAVGGVAAALAGAGLRVGGERDLRAGERAAGRPLASAELGWAPDGSVALHRPDLVCWGAGAPVAVEVELTVKAPERLARIVRGWARSRLIDGVVYYAAAAAARALERAVARESAVGRVVVLDLERAGALPAFDRSVPSQGLRSVGAHGQRDGRRP